MTGIKWKKEPDSLGNHEDFQKNQNSNISLDLNYLNNFHSNVL